MTETFAISAPQAELYEAQFVPALFGPLAPWLIETVGVTATTRVLDVACGTGIVARTVAERIAGSNVTGLDLNDAMLTVARRLEPGIEWRQGDVGALPFPDATFDVVACQAGLMFFPDATEALAEMRRVTRRNGVVGVQVFNGLAEQRAYGPWIEMVTRHVGADAARLLGTYWVHGDVAELRQRFATAGLAVRDTTTREFVLAFDSIGSFVRTEIGATPLVDRMSEEQYRAILDESEGVLAEFVGEHGAAIPITARIMTGTPLDA